MEKKCIGAGLGAGLLAGIVTYVFARIALEPQVSAAISYEEGRSAAHEALEGAGGHAHEHGEVFSRTVQEGLGAAVGSIAFALCMGAIFAVAFTVLWGYLGRRYPGTDPRWVAAAIGAIGFIVVFAVPFLVYPANPPAVGDGQTIGARTSAFLTITVTSVVAAVVAVAVVVTWLRPRLGGFLSALIGVVGYVATVVIAALALPSFKEVPGPMMNGPDIAYPGFPAEVLGSFRMYTIADHAILWAVLTASFILLSLVALRRREGDTTYPAAQRVGS
ncbi:CbtA family protein [Gordonia sp. ABSL11-1]|uniref:CbtA family protein n=1 Tax=Gordonia sp. ABSL11-1 TaxID=3053924 RepID=UPI0025745C3E|nr:CbtA family protein [Gordonia sp. ABSL11-1]MDL9948934.1 CbtA family protein [Gordonia sp. ABSL11-1]